MSNLAGKFVQIPEPPPPPPMGVCIPRTGLLKLTTGLEYWTRVATGLDQTTGVDYIGLDQTTGVDYWTGLLDWTTGLDYWTDLFATTIF